MTNNEKRAKGMPGVLRWIVEKAVGMEVRVEQGLKYLIGPKLCMRLGLEISDYMTREFLEYLRLSGISRGIQV